MWRGVYMIEIWGKYVTEVCCLWSVTPCSFAGYLADNYIFCCSHYKIIFDCTSSMQAAN